MQEFPEPDIEDRKILTPTPEHFPITWNNNENSALEVEVLEIICKNMQIDHSEIELDFFENGIKEINMGSSVIFLESAPDSFEPAGLYHTEKINGKFNISLDQALLEEPDILIATMAHELAHVKLLGEKKLKENDEMTTDLATVFFGLGIFNANAAFQFYNQSDRWGHSSLGYLSTEEWAYALALLAFIRNEDEPHWKNHLSKSILSDFERSLQYMIDHEEEIFNNEEEE